MIMSEQGIKYAFISLICVCLGTLLGVELKADNDMKAEDHMRHIEVDMETAIPPRPQEETRI